jgi:hypothetical protein
MEGCAMTSLPHPVESARLDETHLLQRRMTVLRLDVEVWPNMEPAMFVDLEKSCSACASRNQCAYDLLAHLEEPTWSDWRDYCLNAAKLRMLVALQGFLKKNLPIERQKLWVIAQSFDRPVVREMRIIAALEEAARAGAPMQP